MFEIQIRSIHMQFFLSSSTAMEPLIDWLMKYAITGMECTDYMLLMAIPRIEEEPIVQTHSIWREEHSISIFFPKMDHISCQTERLRDAFVNFQPVLHTTEPTSTLCEWKEPTFMHLVHGHVSLVRNSVNLKIIQRNKCKIFQETQKEEKTFTLKLILVIHIVQFTSNDICNFASLKD